MIQFVPPGSGDDTVPPGSGDDTVPPGSGDDTVCSPRFW